MKPRKEDLLFLSNYAKDYSSTNNYEDNKQYIEIPGYIASYFETRKQISPISDERTLKIKELIDNNKNAKFSCPKLSILYKDKYGDYISKTVLNEILRNRLKFRYLKTIVKNDVLLTKESIKATFFVLKVLIRHIKLGGTIIYLDESTFTTVNNNYKAWRQQNAQLFQSIKDNGKVNLLSAISSLKLFHWKLYKENTTSELFKDFFSEMISSLNEEEKKTALFFLDNASIHSTLEMMTFYQEKK